MSAGTRQGIILFAHGARDARWADPFERLRESVASRMPDARVLLAFLELMAPDLDAAAATLAADACERITVIPIFFGQGSHLRRDLPLLVDRLRARLPAVAITVAQAAGEDDAVLASIADYCERASMAS